MGLIRNQKSSHICGDRIKCWKNMVDQSSIEAVIIKMQFNWHVFLTSILFPLLISIFSKTSCPHDNWAKIGTLLSDWMGRAKHSRINAHPQVTVIVNMNSKGKASRHLDRLFVSVHKNVRQAKWTRWYGFNSFFFFF